jgi:hypothetical protein
MIDDGASPSMLVAGGVRFAQPIPLGMGFTLDAVGALLALRRAVAADDFDPAAVIDSMLAPVQSIDQVVTRADALARALPHQDGAMAIAIAARIGWGAPASILAADLALLYDTSTPSLIIALARVRVGIPSLANALVNLTLRARGLLDLADGTLVVEAELVGSRLIGLNLSGGALVVVRWGARPTFALSVGGFRPGYQLPPGLLRDVKRPARIALEVPPTPFLRLRLEGYLAITPGTVQLGANIDAFIGIRNVASAEGSFGFDALIDFSPLHFDAAIHGKVALRIFGLRLVSASLEGRLTGPGRWHAVGKVTFGVLWWDVSYHFDVQTGSRPALPPSTTIDVTAALAAAVRASAAWTPSRRSSDGVRLRAVADDALLLHPLDELILRQVVVPLGEVVTRIGAARATRVGRHEVSRIRFGAADAPEASTRPVTESFAPGHYRDLDDGERLTARTFNVLRAGVHVIPHDATAGPSLTPTPVYDEHVIDAAGTHTRQDVPGGALLGRASPSVRWRTNTARMVVTA